MADDIRTCADLDERLTPYADGEASPAARSGVAAHLAGCPPCREAARTETAARNLLHEHRSALAARASEGLRARCACLPQTVAGQGGRAAFRPPPTSSAFRAAVRRWAPLSVGATLVLAVAGVFVLGLNNRVEALAASLAVDHVKCFKITGTAPSADAASSEEAWQAHQGWPVAVPRAEPARQLRLVNVRRCFSSAGRAAHMMYTWHGEPLSLYVLQGEAGQDRVVRTLGSQAVVWCANRRTYAVVSSDASIDLAPIVDYMKTRVK